MRPIDADALIKRIKKEPTDGFFINELLEILNSQPTIESDKWIPVTPDTMPKARYYPPVICCNIEDVWTDSAVVNDGGAFINCEGCHIYPTHWQPLPEAYMPEGEKE